MYASDDSLIAAFAGCSLDEKPGSNWVQEAGGLPQYICEVARAIKRSGKTTGTAIAIAISRIRKWAATGDATTKAKAAAALAEWEKLKAKSHATVKATYEDGSEYDLLNFCATEYNVDAVRQAWNEQERQKRDAVRQARAAQVSAGLDPDLAVDPSPYRYIKEQWTTFLIVEDERGRRGGQLSRVPVSVDPKDGTVTFGKETPVVMKYVDSSGNAVGDDLSDDDIQALMAASASPLQRIQALGDSLAMTNVAGYWRHGPHGKVWVPSYNDKRKDARPDMPGSGSSKVSNRTKPGNGTFDKGPSARASSNAGAGPTNAEKIANAAKMFGEGSKQHKAAQQRFGGKPRRGFEFKSGPSKRTVADSKPAPDTAKAEPLKPGKYHTKNGTKVGKAHIHVDEKGNTHYVNSRGEKSPLTAEKAQKNVQAGMNHHVPHESDHGKKLDRKDWPKAADDFLVDNPDFGDSADEFGEAVDLDSKHVIEYKGGEVSVYEKKAKDSPAQKLAAKADSPAQTSASKASAAPSGMHDSGVKVMNNAMAKDPKGKRTPHEGYKLHSGGTAGRAKLADAVSKDGKAIGKVSQDKLDGRGGNLYSGTHVDGTRFKGSVTGLAGRAQVLQAMADHHEKNYGSEATRSKALASAVSSLESLVESARLAEGDNGKERGWTSDLQDLNNLVTDLQKAVKENKVTDKMLEDAAKEFKDNLPGDIDGADAIKELLALVTKQATKDTGSLNSVLQKAKKTS